MSQTIRGVVNAGDPGVLEPKARPGAKADFGRALMDAVEKVDGLQVQADDAASRLAAGEGNLHEVALDLEKADVAMRLMVKVRNRVVEAYQEVMRMGV